MIDYTKQLEEENAVLRARLEHLEAMYDLLDKNYDELKKKYEAAIKPKLSPGVFIKEYDTTSYTQFTKPNKNKRSYAKK
jgi:hypothetical protein